MIELAGKTALITGGGGGIGGGMAEAFVEAGMNVMLADIELDFAQAKAAELGAAATAITLDVTSLESWASAKAIAGEVDILCNNAGIAMPFQSLLDTDPALFERIMKINVTGVYNGIRTFAPAMKARKSGHIVNTSSPAWPVRSLLCEQICGAGAFGFVAAGTGALWRWRVSAVPRPDPQPDVDGGQGRYGP
jgi:NADP-dependent 3-hydroxy acid dehydrogenase YdfG